MRKAKRDLQDKQRKPRVKHSLKERAELRAIRRKSGPSAVRRRERRAYLQPKGNASA